MTVSATEYLKLKFDQARLVGAEGLSVFFARMLSLVLVLVAIAVMLQFSGFALALWIGDAAGSQAVGFASVGGFFMVAALVLFLLRKRLFVNSFVRFFVSLFFNDMED